MPDLPELGNDDPLGRRVFSERRARKAANKQIIVPDIFIQKDADSLSVDRLDHASDTEMAAIANNTSSQDRDLQGWATITVKNVARSGRSVDPTPQLDNPYHADIELNLPSDEQRRKDEGRRHANELAAAACWRPCP